MKKLMTVLLGLSFLGATAMFAQVPTAAPAKTTAAEKKAAQKTAAAEKKAAQKKAAAEKKAAEQK